MVVTVSGNQTAAYSDISNGQFYYVDAFFTPGVGVVNTMTIGGNTSQVNVTGQIYNANLAGTTLNALQHSFALNVSDGGVIQSVFRSVVVDSTARISNHGEISVATYAPDFSAAAVTGYSNLYLDNTGFIGFLTFELSSFNGIAIQTLGNTPDYVRNSGTIAGNINLGAANDRFVNVGGVVIGSVRGGTGDDTYVIDTANIKIYEGSNAGFDAVESWVSYQLTDNVEQLTLLGIENINGHGNTQDNAIIDNAASNVLFGGKGNDRLIHSMGDDVIRGGRGTDTFVFLSTDPAASGAKVDLNKTGWQDLGEDYDSVLLKSIESVEGSDADDIIIGNKFANTLSGEDGMDDLRGNGGDDILYGGHDGDTLRGGAGRDSFFYLSVLESYRDTGKMDRISDFKHRQDTIDLELIDAIDGGGDDAFDFIGGRRFSNTAGELRYVRNSGLLEADTDGDGTADLSIILANKPLLTDVDFNL